MALPRPIPMHKRKKKLVNKALQLKLVAVFTVIGTTCALFQVVLINFGLLDIARSVPAGGTELLEQARWMMLTNTLWTVGALIPLMTCIGILATHRIAGPAYRMRVHLEEIAEGGPVRPCKIRKNDELQGLCSALNAAFERVAPSGDASEDFTEEWALESTPSLARKSGDEAGGKKGPKKGPKKDSAKDSAKAAKKAS